MYDKKAITKYMLKNHDKVRLNQAKYKKKIRQSLINMLGGECIQCGFRDYRALQIDHIGGGGSSGKRRKLGGYHYTEYKKYTENPELANKEIQVLCANCNYIKRYTHKEVSKHDIY